MQDLQEYLAAVAENTLFIRPGTAGREPLLRIEFLSDAAELRPNCIYLLTAAELDAYRRDPPPGGAAFFIACSDAAYPVLPPAFEASDCAVVSVGMELLPLYARLNGTLAALTTRYRIDDILRMAETMRYTPEQLIQALSEMLRIGLYVLDGTDRIISGSAAGVADHPLAAELAARGSLSEESLRTVRAGGQSAMLYEGSAGKWSRFSLLVLWRPGDPIDAPYLSERYRDYVIEYLSRSGPAEIPPFLVEPRLNHILEGKVSDETEIRSFFGGDGAAPVWFSVLTLGAEPGVRWNAEAYQKQAYLLSAAFRDVSLTVNRGRLCGVLRLPLREAKDDVFSREFFDERAYADGWDAQRLAQELQKLDVFLCRSSIFRTWHYFPAEYTLISDALDIAIKLDGKRIGRMVDFRQYSSYVAVKYAVDRFIEMQGPRNIRAVLYPELVTLLLHDIKNHTDYVEVLYRYYTYGDVKSTAQSLFVHRNTIYNKLKSIQQLLNVDLEDYAVRSSYLTSLRVYYYCEKCLGLDLRTMS